LEEFAFRVIGRQPSDDVTWSKLPACPPKLAASATYNFKVDAAVAELVRVREIVSAIEVSEVS
jgi:hypothetical protein